MAAEALLVNGTTEILKKLSSIVVQEIGGAWGVKGDLKKLQSTLNLIQAKLQDAEKRQTEEEAVRLWLRNLKEVAYDIDNILDDFAYGEMRYKLETQKHLKKKVLYFFSHSNPIAFHFKMAHKIKNINEFLKQIKEDASDFQLQVGYVDPSLPTKTRLSRETISLVNDSEIFGRSADKSKIVDMLIRFSHQEPLSVLPIVGLGGLGKTTLAQLVYNDELVVRYFDIRMWVYVSERFDVTQILSKVSEAATRSESKIKIRDLVAQSIQEKLSGKRFLLVLDDVWNEDSVQWEDLKTPLGFGANGSKIVVTTRSDKVGAIMGTLPLHRLETLSKEDSWSLFKKRAFRSGGPKETPDLVQIGRKIAKKCGGVPLAAKSIGGLMFLKRDIHEWLDVLNSEIWNLNEDRSGILLALKLSYDHMPSPIKQCFAYCSLFAKGETIEKNMLIQLWSAQGLLQITKENQLKNDIGDEYFSYLVLNCFFQNVQEAYTDSGEKVTCNMHDLVVDLARFVARPELLHYEANTSIEDVSRLLHLHILYDRQEQILEAYHKAKKLRSFFWYFERPQVSTRAIDSICFHFKYLRVLDFSYGGVVELSSSIGMLKHLRYLDLSSNGIKALPESITNLYNLQTLRLNDCYYLERLPKEMRKLVNLTYLVMSDHGRLNQTPFQIGQLNSLQLLPYFFVGNESGYRMEELEHLPLRDKLSILDLWNVKSGNEAKRANLKGKPKITHLTLSWERTEGDDDDDDGTRNDEDVMEGLEPHPYLKLVEIHYYRGFSFPKWMMDVSLHDNLVMVTLWNCMRCRELPMLGKLPHLKILVLRGMHAVEYFGSKFYDGRCSSDMEMEHEMFPSLEKLHLWEMPKLVEWIEVVPAFRCLKELFICGCPELKTIQTQFPSLQDFAFQRSNDIVLSSMSELNSLTSLEISKSPQLTSLPKELMQNMNLQKLKIIECPKLEVVLPSENQGVHEEGLPISLDLLVIKDCPALMSLPDLWEFQSLRILSIGGFSNLISLPHGLQGITTLEELEIGPFSEELDSFPAMDVIQHLASLRTLRIYGWSKLTTLPRELQHLSSLQKLGIHDFHDMMALPEWLGNLSALQTLEIVSCHNLMHLPSLEEIRRLTALKLLSIIDCPRLKERCKNERGEEWYKLANIRHVQFLRYDDDRPKYINDDV